MTYDFCVHVHKLSISISLYGEGEGDRERGESLLASPAAVKLFRP